MFYVVKSIFGTEFFVRYNRASLYLKPMFFKIIFPLVKTLFFRKIFELSFGVNYVKQNIEIRKYEASTDVVQILSGGIKF